MLGLTICLPFSGVYCYFMYWAPGLPAYWQWSRDLDVLDHCLISGMDNLFWQRDTVEKLVQKAGQRLAEKPIEGCGEWGELPQNRGQGQCGWK